MEGLKSSPQASWITVKPPLFALGLLMALAPLADSAVAAAALPAPPLLKRDVHLFDRGKLTRPAIPANRTTNDGRISVDFSSVTQVEFTLLKPEALEQPFDRSPNGYAIIGGDDVAPFNVDRNLFHSSAFTGFASASHHTICEDTPIRTAVSGSKTNPYSCADDPAADCYDLTMIGTNKSGYRVELWGTPFTVKVKSPKTKFAFIESVSVGTPVRGATHTGISSWFEPITSGDGRLFLGRSGFRNVFYSVAAESEPACDVTTWTDRHELTHAYHDPDMRVGGTMSGEARYGIAAYPLRDGAGNLIPDNAALKLTYPWMDKAGDNIFFTSVDATLFYNNQGTISTRYPTECYVSGTGCITNPTTRRAIDKVDTPPALRGIGVVGAWTHGKVLLVDNLTNNIDYGTGWGDNKQYNITLYSGGGANSKVRIGGAGNNDHPQPSPGGPPLASVNPYVYIIDSVENLFNDVPNMVPSTIRDTVWYVNLGKVTDKVVFDEYLNPNVFIFSEWMPVLVHNDTSVPASSRPNLQMHYRDGFVSGAGQSRDGAGFGEDIWFQNSATTLGWKVPPYGWAAYDRLNPKSIRAEPVAQGGVEGRGLWLPDGGSVTYSVPAQAAGRNVDSYPWYVGLYVDPASNDSNVQRELLTFPDGSSIRIKGRATVELVSRDGSAAATFALDGAPAVRKWKHLGFSVRNGGANVDFLVDGFKKGSWSAGADSTRLFRMVQGVLTLGRGYGSSPVSFANGSFESTGGVTFPPHLRSAGGWTFSGDASAVGVVANPQSLRDGFPAADDGSKVLYVGVDWVSGRTTSGKAHQDIGRSLEGHTYKVSAQARAGTRQTGYKLSLRDAVTDAELASTTATGEVKISYTETAARTLRVQIETDGTLTASNTAALRTTVDNIKVTATGPSFEGWTDSLLVIADEVPPELACNYAGGTLVGLKPGYSGPLTAQANWYPAASHAAITTLLSGDRKSTYDKYACLHDYTTDLDMDTRHLPANTASVREDLNFPEGPLAAGVRRADTSGNDFCLSCHYSGSRHAPMKLAALNAGAAAVEADTRRQPSQGPRLAYGNVPAHYYGLNKPVADTVAAASGAVTDAWTLSSPRPVPLSPSGDQDGDGVRNFDDPWPTVASKSSDIDGDRVDDSTDGDKDGDGVSNVGDAFPSDPYEWSDADRDGVGDNADVDRNNDGVMDAVNATFDQPDPRVTTRRLLDGEWTLIDPDQAGDGDHYAGGYTIKRAWGADGETGIRHPMLQGGFDASAKFTQVGDNRGNTVTQWKFIDSTSAMQVELHSHHGSNNVTLVAATKPPGSSGFSSFGSVSYPRRANYRIDVNWTPSSSGGPGSGTWTVKSAVNGGSLTALGTTTVRTAAAVAPNRSMEFAIRGAGVEYILIDSLTLEPAGGVSLANGSFEATGSVTFAPHLHSADGWTFGGAATSVGVVANPENLSDGFSATPYGSKALYLAVDQVGGEPAPRSGKAYQNVGRSEVGRKYTVTARAEGGTTWAGAGYKLSLRDADTDAELASTTNTGAVWVSYRETAARTLRVQLETNGAAPRRTVVDNVALVVDADILPLAEAGPDQSAVSAGATVTLDGGGSSAPPGAAGALSYSWRQTGGAAAVVLSSATASSPTFTAPVLSAKEDLTFELTVSDGVFSAVDSVVVSVNANRAPTADAGEDQAVDEESLVTLSGSGSDPELQALTYRWAQTGGTVVGLNAYSQATTSFTAEDFLSTETLTFQLTVTDPGGLSGTATVQVTVRADNDAPTADAGEYQAVDEGSLVTLSGSGSDPELQALTYAWSQIGGASVTLSGSDTAVPTFTAPDLAADGTLTFQLTVTDPGGLSGTATVQVRVRHLGAWISSPASLSEDSLDGATVAVSLSGFAYVDAANLDAGDFSLSAPAGVTIGGVSRTSAAMATLTLAFAGDIQADAALGVTVLAAGHSGSSALVAEAIPVTATVRDYDSDNDGFIEVVNLAQLNAIRWDLNGDGVVTDNAATTDVDEFASYNAAFPDRATAADGPMGCPARLCAGYELGANSSSAVQLNFDEDGDGSITSADSAYWNDGSGWLPIGDRRHPFGAGFRGNGQAVSRLFINRPVYPDGYDVGLFGVVSRFTRTDVVFVEGVRMLEVNVTGHSRVGGLVGNNIDGIIAASYVTGVVSGVEFVGGLIGVNGGKVVASYTFASVSGSVRVGGLVGMHTNSSTGSIVASYVAGAVSGSAPSTGGLAGQVNDGSITANYWDTEATGQSFSAGSADSDGKTTEQLQSPTSASGIYADWDDLTVDGSGTNDDDPWDFGANNQYPVLSFGGLDPTDQRPSAALISSTAPATLNEGNLNGAQIALGLFKTTFAGVGGSRFELVTEIPGLSISNVAGAESGGSTATLTLAYDGSDFDAAATLAVKVKAAGHSGDGDLVSSTVPVAATDEPATE